MNERARIARDLDSALIRLDTDGLRFVLCVALIRGMDIRELNLLENVLVSKTLRELKR